MRQRFSLGALGVALIVGGYTWLFAQSNASGLQGAWVIQSVSFAKPPTPPLNKPVGIFVFVGNHYAFSGADASRPDFPKGVTPDKATAEQLRATWGSVVTEGGSFTVAGNTIRYSRLVAKGPANMAPNNFTEVTFTLSGDNLVVTQTKNQAGPIANPATVRLTRAK
jgi:hypothetical protein